MPLKPVPIVNALVAVALIVILEEPSKFTPLIVRAVANFVAVDAFPVNDPVTVVARLKTPSVEIILVPSTLTPPKRAVVAFGKSYGKGEPIKSSYLPLVATVDNVGLFRICVTPLVAVQLLCTCAAGILGLLVKSL